MAPARPVLPVNDLHRQDDITVDLPTPKRALAVGAHPDDIEFGCGATLAKWASQGCRIAHLILTDGSRGSWDPTQSRPALATTRREEATLAAQRLGSEEVIFGGWSDGELVAGDRQRWVASQVIRRLQPDVVVGHDPWRRYRLHPDHRAAGLILVESVVAARDPHFFPDQGLAPHRPSNMLLWEADVVNHVEDVDGHERQKVSALLAHRSQYETTMDIDPAAVSSDTGGSEGVTPDDPVAQGLLQRIDDQLARQGSMARFARGEAFHHLAEL